MTNGGARTGFSGWLLLPVGGTVVAPFYFAWRLIDEYLKLSAAWPARWEIPVYLANIISLEIGFNLGLLGTSIVAVWLMFKKSKSYPRVFVGLLAGLLATNALLTLLVFWLLEAPPTAWELYALARDVALVAIFVPYMHTSRQVKATFVH